MLVSSAEQQGSLSLSLFDRARQWRWIAEAKTSHQISAPSDLPLRSKLCELYVESIEKNLKKHVLAAQET